MLDIQSVDNPQKKENGLKINMGVLFKNDGWDFLTFY